MRRRPVRAALSTAVLCCVAALGVSFSTPAMGADFAYIGSAFIATEEARAAEAYKQMIVDSTSQDVVYSNLFTGVHGNYLRGSIVAAGLEGVHWGTVVSKIILPALIAPDDGLKGTIKELHETLANIGYALIALHAAAAIYHHHVLKDNTLTNMLPERK